MQSLSQPWPWSKSRHRQWGWGLGGKQTDWGLNKTLFIKMGKTDKGLWDIVSLVPCFSKGDPWAFVTLEEVKPVNLKGSQHWIFTASTVAEAEAPILWLPDAKSRLVGIDSDAGKDWRQKKKGEAEDKMVGWHHQFNGHVSEQTPRENEGQGSLACCSLWGLDLASEQ